MRLEKRILVVDDDDAIRALVTTILRRRGLAVDCARHGAEALEHIATKRYGLVILDLMMPLVSGYEVLEQLGTFAASVRPLVLVLTAGLAPKLLDPTLVIGTIHKPFDIELLVDTVRLSRRADRTAGGGVLHDRHCLPSRRGKLNLASGRGHARFRHVF
jgi:DNA-binding response OmpR family regulator